MNDEQFAVLCSEYPDDFIEVTAAGEIVIEPPHFTLDGIRNGYILGELANWAGADGRGKALDATARLVLPNGARRSADCSWIDSRRIRGMDQRYLNRYWRICPNFIIELRSPSDRLKTLRAKMQEWIENGAQLAWLIDPESRAVEIYRPDRDPETLVEAQSIEGEGPVAGFTLNLAKVWDPLT